MTVALRSVSALCLVLATVACDKKAKVEATQASSSTSPMAMDTAAASKGDSTSVVLNAAQIAHGKIKWQPATSGSFSAGATVPGIITPDEDRTAHLSVQADARVIAVHVQPGERVSRGQVLVTLQSPGAVAAQSDLSKATAAVTSARAQAAYARAARDRAERLLALKAISRQEYERAVADDELARAMLAQAVAEARRAGTTARQLGTVTSGNGEIVLRSPLAGVVLLRAAQAGSVVAPGTELVSVTDPSVLWLQVSAPERFAGLFHTGDPLHFSVPAYPGEVFDARVTSIGAGLDPETRTLPVRASVTSVRGKLKPEMLASVAVTAGRGAPATLIPDEAIQTMDGKPVVFIARPARNGAFKFSRREVEIGCRSGGVVSVIRGLAPGEMVVTAGSFTVKAEMEKGAMPGMVM